MNKQLGNGKRARKPGQRAAREFRAMRPGARAGIHDRIAPSICKLAAITVGRLVGDGHASFLPGSEAIAVPARTFSDAMGAAFQKGEIASLIITPESVMRLLMDAGAVIAAPARRERFAAIVLDGRALLAMARAKGKAVRHAKA